LCEFVTILAVQLVQPLQPPPHLTPPLHDAHASVLMQAFVKLASCLFRTIVELFGRLQRLSSVVFRPERQLASQPSALAPFASLL
jgi:hypothetical protein